MKLFLGYIRQHWRAIIINIIFCFIFLLSFSLYHLPIQAVLYPTILCIFFGLLWIFFDIRHVKQKQEMLKNIHSITDVMIGAFPKIESIEEEEYQQIIHLVCEEYKNYHTKRNQQYLMMIDYYTVWCHQIKTPIASMKLHLQNEDTILSRKLSTDLFRIEQYVEMVLTFLRLNTESTDYVIKEYDLDTIIKQSVKKFAGEFISRKLKLVYEPFHTTVITDEKWLSFVIEQVLSNALKYTSSGSITITLKPEKKLCICDTGIGIETEDLPRIFENGFTGYNGRLDKKASGIGLYLCKRICNNLGHSIKAESIVGKGTTILIDLMQKQLKVE